MHEQDPEYLRPGFQPSSATMARLRSILITHDVAYASNASKAQLVALVAEQVLPRAPEILAARRNVVPSDAGIVDAVVGPTVKTHARAHSRQTSVPK